MPSEVARPLTSVKPELQLEGSTSADSSAWEENTQTASIPACATNVGNG